MVVWAVLAPLFTPLIYYVLVPVFRRVARRIGASLPAPEANAA
jgi:p-aminobenzoyl-glutamate transporter AbgT